MFGRRLINTNGEAVITTSFNTVTWTADGTGNTIVVGGVGFQPDFIWAKTRTQPYSHTLFDSVRGTGSTHMLFSDSTNSESTNTSNSSGNGFISSFNTDGFTGATGTSANSYFNLTGNNYVAWCWKAGGAAVTNTDGSITSEVSANVDAGFSVVKYTGNGTSGATVGHGLNSAAEIMICKSRSGSTGWLVYHKDIGNTDYLILNTTDAKALGVAAWNNTSPTISVFSIGNGSSVNTSSATQIAYCFHSVAGFSKFGSYTGNGSATGPTVTTDFEPAFVMIKRTSADASGGNWIIKDNKRNTSNPRTKSLFPNSSSAEVTEYDVDFNATSFQILNADVDINKNGGTYIYMAFANQF
jgi:hypothetical protein